MEACLTVFTQLICLKKVYKKLQSKKHCLWEQGLLELKAVEKKKKNSLEVELLATLVAHLSPSTNFFIFNLFFLILPNMIFNNTPIPFL